MKRMFAMLLAIAMTLGLTACGGKTEPAAPNSGNNAQEPAVGEVADPAEETYDLIWAGTSASSGYYALNVALCNIINSYVDGVTVTLMETGGTVDDYKLMRSGEASFAQTSAPNEYCLQNNVGVYEDFGYTDSYDLCFFVPQAAYFVVAEESGLQSLDELAGQKFNAGLAGSAIESEVMNIFGEIGIEPDWYPASTADAVDAICNRQITGFCKTGTTLSTDSTIANVMSSIDIEVLGFTQEQADAVHEKFPYFGFDTVSGDLFGLDHDILTYCANFGFSVSKDLPEDVVYKIIKAFDEHLDEIAAAYPGITDDPVALTASPVDSSLIHPGVIKYMEEKGIEVPAHRIPG